MKHGGAEHGRNVRWNSQGLSSFCVKRNSNCEGSDRSGLVSSTSALTWLASRRKVEVKKEERKSEFRNAFSSLLLFFDPLRLFRHLVSLFRLPSNEGMSHAWPSRSCGQAEVQTRFIMRDSLHTDVVSFLWIFINNYRNEYTVR